MAIPGLESSIPFAKKNRDRAVGVPSQPVLVADHCVQNRIPVHITNGHCRGIVTYCAIPPCETECAIPFSEENIQSTGVMLTRFKSGLRGLPSASFAMIGMLAPHVHGSQPKYAIAITVPITMSATLSKNQFSHASRQYPAGETRIVLLPDRCEELVPENAG